MPHVIVEKLRCHFGGKRDCVCHASATSGDATTKTSPPPPRSRSFVLQVALDGVFRSRAVIAGGGGGAKDEDDDNDFEGNHSSCVKYDVSLPNANFPAIRRNTALFISIDISLVAVMGLTMTWGRSARIDGRVNDSYSSDLKRSTANVIPPARFLSTPPQYVRDQGRDVEGEVHRYQHGVDDANAAIVVVVVVARAVASYLPMHDR